MPKEFQNVGYFGVKPFPRLVRFFKRHISGARSIYDHGCGYGGWTSYLAELTDARVAIYDPDVKAQEHTKKLLGESYTECKGPFDAIICFGVLELLEREAQVNLLKEFRQKLKGSLLVQYNVYNPLALRWLAIRLSKGDPVSWHERHRFHRSYLSRKEVECLFIEAGFSVVERCMPSVENHLPYLVNRFLAQLFPISLHSTIFYAVKTKE
jgi:cyclopropane fatty-acyl-phospholipid synthase-like methyltransferase